MKLAIVGQQDFGRAVLEAFLARGDQVAGVFCAQEKEGARPDPLKVAALERSIPLFQLPSLKGDEAKDALRSLAVDIGIMAYVLQFAPQDFVGIPRHGTIQYHPSLLPLHRGPSSINWPIIHGRTQTGLTIFRPTDGLDEGPVILQKETPIGPDDTLGSLYFDRLFPMGVAAMIEAADLVVAGRHRETVQDQAQATYEGWCRAAEAKICWHHHADQIYDLIRGCNPAPGAWTTVAGKALQLFDSRKHPTRTFAAVKGKIGEVAAIGPESIRISAHGGQIEVFKLKPEGGKKMAATDFARDSGWSVGTVLGG